MSTVTVHPSLPDRIERCDVEEPNLDPELGFMLASLVPDVGTHFIDDEKGTWSVLPGQVHTHLTPEDLRTYMDELAIAATAAHALNATPGATS